MYTQNLNYKNITEFNSDDTIYITGGSPQFPTIYFCQFVKYEKGIVEGKIISVKTNPDLHSNEIGKSITGKLNKCSLFGETEHDHNTHFHFFDSIGFAAYEIKKDPFDAKIPSVHPSYCTVRFSRTNSSHQKPFFGSSIKPNSYITLTISSAEIDRKLNNDWIHSGRELIQVGMTEAQFAELITTINMGSGTPATLFHDGKKKIEEPPYISKVEQHSMEFSNKMHEMSENLKNNFNKIQTIINSDKPINKQAKAELINMYNSMITQINSNIPFYEQQFLEQMQNTVHEAKMEINQHIQQEAQRLGINTIKHDSILKIDFDKQND